MMFRAGRTERKGRAKTLLAVLLPVILLVLPFELQANVVQDTLAGECNTAVSEARTSTPIQITVPVVRCMQAIVDAIGTDLLAPIVDKVRNTVLGLMVLALIVVSLKIMFGSLKKDMGKELTILLIKISAISYFALNLNFMNIVNDMKQLTGDITDAALSVMEFKAEVAVGQSGLSGVGPNNKRGTINEAGGASIEEGDTNPYNIPGGQIWFFADDLIRTLLGFSGDASFGTAMGSIAMKGAFIFVIWKLLMLMGPIGAWVATTVLGVVFMTFLSIAMAVYVYISSILALLFITSLAPVVIPLILFRSWGMPIFSRWVKQIISYVMQPLILTIFFIFMLNVMHGVIWDLKALYLDAYKTMRDDTNRNRVSLMEIADFHKKESDTTPTESKGRSVLKYVSGQYLVEEMTGSMTGVMQGNITVPFLNWGWDRVKEFVITMLLALVCMLAMFTFQKELPHIVSDLIGEGGKLVPNLAQPFTKLKWMQ